MGAQERALGGERQREKPTPRSAGRPRCVGLDPRTQDLDLSPRQSLNQLSHPSVLLLHFKSPLVETRKLFYFAVPLGPLCCKGDHCRPFMETPWPKTPAPKSRRLVLAFFFFSCREKAGGRGPLRILLIPKLCKNEGHTIISKHSVDSHMVVVVLVPVDWKYLLVSEVTVDSLANLNESVWYSSQQPLRAHTHTHEKWTKTSFVCRQVVANWFC